MEQAPVKKRKLRVQLTAIEKKYFEEKLESNVGTLEYMQELVEEWNSRPNQTKQIDIGHITRIYEKMPDFNGKSFWKSVKRKVMAELAIPGAEARFKPRKDNYDYADYKTERVDPTKVQPISDHQLEPLRFPFENEKYNRSDT